jgi:hypothetical protein
MLFSVDKYSHFTGNSFFHLQGKKEWLALLPQTKTGGSYKMFALIYQTILCHQTL